jgi:hypothetical protein
MSASTSTPAAGARLVITNQESAEQEAIHKNGENKQLHSVIKNVPFIIDLSLEGDFDRRVINFNNFTLEATLMYDTCEEKAVHYVSRRPVEYNCTVDKTSAGDKVRVECILNVLSSQHEGAYFRLRFSAASLAQHVLSDPIRVVSKPLQLKKVKEQRKAAAAAASVEGKTTAASKKRPLSDCNSSIQDTLARIEAQQQAQQTLISSLFQTVMTQLPLTPAAPSAPNTPVSSPYYCAGNPATPSSSASPAAIFAQPATPPAKRRRLDNPAAQQAPAAAATSELQATFEGHLRGLIDSFHAITPSRRAQAVHSAVMGASATQVEKLSGLVDVLCAEGLGRTAHISLGGGSSVPSRSSQLPYHPTWQLSSASSPLVSAGADASDDDDDAATETWLSTETSPTSTSPMSPGEGQFSFNSIDVLFDPASAELPKPAAVVGDFDDDELYTELFSSQGWLLDQGEASSSF